MRTFEHAPAVRHRVWLRLGLAGPTGSGKSLSSHLLAYGMALEDPGPVWLINTEGPNGLLYAPKPGKEPTPPTTFPFTHLPFEPPHRTPDYLAAVLYAVKNGARHVIVDGGHFEHEAYLQYHEEEVIRLVGKNDTWERRNKMAITAWIRPSAERHKALLDMRLIPANIIWCFQGKEKLKINKKGGSDDEKMVEMGWQPIAGAEVTAELPIRFILPAGADGVPTLRPELPGEKLFNRVPIELRQEGFLTPGRALDIDLGRKLQQWAMADSEKPTDRPQDPPSQQIHDAENVHGEQAALMNEIREVLRRHKLGSKSAAAPVQLAFGTDWAGVCRMDADGLLVGLAALKLNLDGVAAMRERQPGEDE